MQSQIDTGVTSALVAALLVLVETLEASGALSRDDYCRRLRVLWDEMPEEDAQGSAGFMMERLLDMLTSGRR